MEYEDGSCVSTTTEVVENGTDLTYQVGECTRYGYQWTPIMDVDDPTELGDFEYISSMTKKQGCANPGTVVNITSIRWTQFIPDRTKSIQHK